MAFDDLCATLHAPNSETIARRYWEAGGRLSSLINVPVRVIGKPVRTSLANRHPFKERNSMRKYLIAAALTAVFVSPALAEQFYVVFDPASHKCEAMHNIPEGKKSMGTYGSMDEAKKAMATMKECG